MWRPDDAQTQRAHGKTQIGITSGDRQLLCKTARGIKHFPPHRQTRARQRQHLTCVAEISHVTRCAAWRVPPHVARLTIGPTGHPGMLYAAIAIKQLGANHAYFRTQSLRNQFAQPVRMQDFDIVVQQHDHRAA